MLTYVFVVWALITAALAGLAIYRGTISMKEEDQIFLDKAEDHLAREQQELVARADRLSRPITALAVASGVIFVVMAVMWVREGLSR